MFEDLQDDAIAWVNYSPTAHPAEIVRMAQAMTGLGTLTAIGIVHKLSHVQNRH